MAEITPLRLPLESFQFDNGLRVFIHHDETIPIVAVNVWYHVGSKDDDPNLTGLAHLFEHLMFEGSAGHNNDFFKPLQEAGGFINGSTSPDRTNYYEVVPSEFLELALWLEADRMANLLPVLTESKLDTQRSVVMNERRQRVDNQPYGRVGERIAELVFPSGHPYSWPVIGWMEHLERVTLTDVQRFFSRYYCPANATLTVAGSFDPERARRWIDKYFRGVSSPLKPDAVHADGVVLDRPKRLELRETVALPRLDLVWLTQPTRHEDEPALDYAAHILGGRSKDSRLRRRLIHERKLVNTVGTYHYSAKLAGQWGVRAFALPDASLAEIEQEVLAETERLRREPPTPEEMQRTRHEFFNQAYSRLETVLGRADAFAYHFFTYGSVAGDAFAEELARYERVTPEQVREAADRYLHERFVAVTVAPEETTKSSRASTSESKPKAPGSRSSTASPNSLPTAGQRREFRLPVIERAEFANGLRVLFVRRQKLPRIDVQWLSRGGSAYDPLERLGLARLTADVLDEGADEFDGLELARRLDVLGSALGSGAGVESASVSLRALRSTFEESFALFARVVQRPRFAAADLDRERDRLLAELAYRDKQPGSIADDAIDAAIYPPTHPYGRPEDGTRDGISKATPEDLQRFHTAHFHPARSTLLVVGDTTLSEVADLVEKHFARSPAASREGDRPDGLDHSASHAERLTVVDRPGSAQSVLRIGCRSVPRKHPDYFALLILNTVLGGQFSSRLNLNLREEKGYTYGARSSFVLRRFGGSFVAGADVQSSATSAAVEEFLREIAATTGRRPIDDRELSFAKAYLTRRFPARFETNGGVAAHLAQLAIYDLPDDYYSHYLANIERVSREQILEAAQRHLKPSSMRVVVVGDAQHTDGLAETVAQLSEVP